MPELIPIASTDIFHELIPEEFRNAQPVSANDFYQQQCDWYNESTGSLTGIDCPDCKNRGNFQLLDSEGNRVMRECKCMTQRRYIQMMQNAGLGDLYQKCTFDAYIASEDWQQRNKAAAMKYAGQDGNSWFLFAGASGVGKTHLCTAICSELAKRGRGIKYVQWKKLFDSLVQTKFKQYEQDAIFAEIESADVLYLDDFLKTPRNAPPKEEALSYALEIVDARYKKDKKTIFSTEFMINDIISFDEALGGRIREKTMGNKIMNEHKPGRNYRMRGAAE